MNVDAEITFWILYTMNKTYPHHSGFLEDRNHNDNKFSLVTIICKRNGALTLNI